MTDWPSFRLKDFPRWMDFLGVLAGITALVIPSDLPLLDRFGVAAIVLLSLLLLRFVGLGVAIVKVVRLRTKGYSLLHFQLNRIQEELGQERVRTIDLARVLWAYRSILREFSVTNAAIFDEDTQLVVDTGAEHLRSGTKLMVINPLSGAWLGKFEVTRMLYGGNSYLAKPIDIGAPVWWGFIRQEAQAHVVPSLKAVAIVVPTWSEE